MTFEYPTDDDPISDDWWVPLLAVEARMGESPRLWTAVSASKTSCSSAGSDAEVDRSSTSTESCDCSAPSTTTLPRHDVAQPHGEGG